MSDSVCSVISPKVSPVQQHVFVDPPPLYLHRKCPVCLETLLPEPYLASCCGNHFCEKCVKNLNQKPCPICKDDDPTTNPRVPDKGQKRALNSLHIYCTNKEKSCDWSGELGMLEDHLVTTCLHAPLTCKCGLTFPRNELSVHESDICPNRMAKCKFCDYSAKHTKVLKHEQKCPNAVLNCPHECRVTPFLGANLRKHLKQCPNVPVPCTFAHAGCKWEGPRNTIDSHLEQTWRQHISDIGSFKAVAETMKSREIKIKTLSKKVSRQATVIKKMIMLMAGTSSVPPSPISSQSVGGIRPPLASQAPPPPSQPALPQGPAAQILLLQATQQDNNSKQIVGPGPNNTQPLPGNNTMATTSDSGGFIQQSTPTLNQPNPTPAPPAPAPGNMMHNQINPHQQPMSHPPPANQQPATVQQPVQQTQIWSGILETYEPRGNNPRQPRPVQCSIHISKPDIAQEIKPESWPAKLIMNTYSKNLFNAFTAFFRNHQNHLRTVHFQFLERPENVIMLRALSDLPQNKKIGIIQLGGSLPQCPIKAFIMICQEKSQSKQFTGLISLDQEKFIATLKQALAVQSRQPQASQMHRAGLPSNLLGTANPMMTQQHMTQQQGAGGTGMGLSTSVGGSQQQQMMGGTSNTMDNQNTFNTSNQGGGTGGVAGNNMFMSGQQQNYSSMMGSSQPSSMQQQQQYSMTSGGTQQQQQQQAMLQQQQIRANLQMGGGGQQQQQMQSQQPMGGGQQLGGQLGGQLSIQQKQQLKQALENATPEKRQMIYAKIEQQRAMRLQQQQQHYQQQQQNQMYGGGGGMQQQQPSAAGQQQMGRQPIHNTQQQQQMPGGGGGMQGMQQQQPPPGGPNTGGGTTGTGGGSTRQILDFFQSF